MPGSPVKNAVTGPNYHPAFRNLTTAPVSLLAGYPVSLAILVVLRPGFH